MGSFDTPRTVPLRILSQKIYHSLDHPFRPKSHVSYDKWRRMNSIRGRRPCARGNIASIRSKQIAKSLEDPWISQGSFAAIWLREMRIIQFGVHRNKLQAHRAGPNRAPQSSNLARIVV